MTESEHPVAVPTPTGSITPGLRKLVVICAVSAAISGFCALGLSVYSAANTHQAVSGVHTAVTGIQSLLLNGKTASAISAKKTANEVNLLRKQQAFDHKQTVTAEAQARNAQEELQAVVQEVERHLDMTIRTSIAAAASKFASQLGH